MLKLTTVTVAILVSSPALACWEEARRPVSGYSYGYAAPARVAGYAYADDGYYGGYYGYGGVGLALAAIPRGPFWRYRWDNGERGYVAHRAAFRASNVGRGGGVGRTGGGRIGGRR